jgi:hypothetical protein
MGIPDDEDGLIRFIIDTLGLKRKHYQSLLEHEYSQDRYPEKEAVTAARDLMADILSQSKDNVALLNRLIAKQDDLRDITEDMEAVETFFDSKSQQKAIFDSARQLLKELRIEHDYLLTDNDSNAKISEINAILAMPKPYDRIKNLTELMQGVKNAYKVLLEEKKNEVNGMITQCMGDVHTLAGVGMAVDAVKKADDRFVEYKQKAADATSLTVLDAMITQLLNYKDTVCKQIETMLQIKPDLICGEAPPKPPKFVQIRRYDIFTVKRLQSREDIDAYLENIKMKLYNTLDNNDGIQII